MLILPPGHLVEVNRLVSGLEHGAQAPTREIFLKGAGLLFKGNPMAYLTPLQILVRP